MCRLLKIPRSSYYYKAIEPVSEIELEEKVINLFRENKARYGARNLKQVLEADGVLVSRRRIRRIMISFNLVSVYQKSSFKPHSKAKNEAPIPNQLNRQFDEHMPLSALVTDLTYVRISSRWAYVCFIIDL